jgi:hypothetical protein
VYDCGVYDWLKWLGHFSIRLTYLFAVIARLFAVIARLDRAIQ